jgi:hypothetical protein
METLYNIHAKVLYKDTEDKYTGDPDVDPEDLHFVCQELYQHELLSAFRMDDTDFKLLVSKIERIYEIVKDNPTIREMVRIHFIQDEITTFFVLFNYDTFSSLHKIFQNYL